MCNNTTSRAVQEHGLKSEIDTLFLMHRTGAIKSTQNVLFPVLFLWAKLQPQMNNNSETLIAQSS